MRLLKSWEALTLALVMHVENKTNDLQPRQLGLPFHDLFFCFFFFPSMRFLLRCKAHWGKAMWSVCWYVNHQIWCMAGIPLFILKTSAGVPLTSASFHAAYLFDWLFGQYLSLQVYCCIMQDHCLKPPSMYHHNSFTYVIFHLLDY